MWLEEGSAVLVRSPGRRPVDRASVWSSDPFTHEAPPSPTKL
jgi:hypothetical protein